MKLNQFPFEIIMTSTFFGESEHFVDKIPRNRIKKIIYIYFKNLTNNFRHYDTNWGFQPQITQPNGCTFSY